MEEQPEEHDALRGAVDDRDWILQAIAEWAKHGFNVALTLTTPAGLLSGMACSGKEYIEHLENIVLGNFTGDAKNEMSEVFKHWKSAYEPVDDESDDGNEVLYIHLRDAKLLVDNRFVPASGTLWRGRISDITGFSLGILEVSEG